MNEKPFTEQSASAIGHLVNETRRTFLSRNGLGLGAMALAMLASDQRSGAAQAFEGGPLGQETSESGPGHKGDLHSLGRLSFPIGVV
jgi:hypothetical protein